MVKDIGTSAAYLYDEVLDEFKEWMGTYHPELGVSF